MDRLQRDRNEPAEIPPRGAEHSIEEEDPERAQALEPEPTRERRALLEGAEEQDEAWRLIEQPDEEEPTV